MLPVGMEGIDTEVVQQLKGHDPVQLFGANTIRTWPSCFWRHTSQPHRAKSAALAAGVVSFHCMSSRNGTDRSTASDATAAAEAALVEPHQIVLGQAIRLKDERGALQDFLRSDPMVFADETDLLLRQTLGTLRESAARADDSSEQKEAVDRRLSMLLEFLRRCREAGFGQAFGTVRLRADRNSACRAERSCGRVDAAR